MLKKLFKNVLCINLLFASLLSINIQANEPFQRKVSVAGSATTLVTPNIIKWALSIRNEGLDLNIVAKDHTQKVDHVLTFLQKQGIKKKHIQTTRMSFGEKKKYTDGNQINDGYYAFTNIGFDLDTLEKYSALWLSLSKMKNISVTSVSYDIKERIEVRNKTRIAALLVAKKKAEDLAHALDADIGEPLIIEDLEADFIRPNQRSQNAMFSTAQSDMSSGGLAVGKIPIEMKVNATFKLISPKQ